MTHVKQIVRHPLHGGDELLGSLARENLKLGLLAPFCSYDLWMTKTRGKVPRMFSDVMIDGALSGMTDLGELDIVLVHFFLHDFLQDLER